MRVIVNTPTGNIGRALVKRLQQSDCQLTLMARHPEKVKDAADRGATVLHGNLDDQAFVTRATRGADVLFWITPPDFGAPNVREFQNRVGRIAAQAVRENRIPRVVNISSFGAQLAERTGPILGLRDNENNMNQVAQNVTHLRPGMFMENHLGSLPTIQQMRKIFLPAAGKTKIHAIATRDVAAVAAERVLDTTWSGQHVLELFGPPVTFDEAARTISEALGETVTHVQVTREQARDALMTMGLSRDYANGLIEIFESLENGHLVPDPSVAKRTTPTTFAEFVRDVLVPMARGNPPPP